MAPLPHHRVSTFSISLFRCSRRPIPFCVLQHGPTLIFVVKAFRAVKHEGSSTSERQTGEICQAFYTATSLGTIAFCFHISWRTALLFSSSFLCAWLHLRTFDLTTFLACALLAPAFRSCREISPRRRLALLVFSTTGNSICDAPWLSLKSVNWCAFGIRL